jgi:hypothetical protein
MKWLGYLLAAGLMTVSTPSSAQLVVRSNYTPAQPAIDGEVHESEWQAAERITLIARGGSQRCVFYFMNDEENLYVAVNAVDDTTNTSRTTRTFDNMAIWFRAQIGYWLYGDGRFRRERLDGGPFQSTARGSAQGPPSVANMMYELSIPLNEIGVQPGDTVATGFHYWDHYDTGPNFWWPSNVHYLRLETYGRLNIARKP